MTTDTPTGVLEVEDTRPFAGAGYGGQSATTSATSHTAINALSSLLVELPCFCIFRVMICSKFLTVCCTEQPRRKGGTHGALRCVERL